MGSLVSALANGRVRRSPRRVARARVWAGTDHGAEAGPRRASRPLPRPRRQRRARAGDDQRQARDAPFRRRHGIAGVGGGPMLLVINSNNTNTVFAVFEGDEKRGAWRISTQPHRTADEYMIWLTQLMALEGLERKQITGTVLSNVVPQASFNLKSLCQRYFCRGPLGT